MNHVSDFDCVILFRHKYNHYSPSVDYHMDITTIMYYRKLGYRIH